MKNIHVLPTDKPSRLYFDNKLFLFRMIQISIQSRNYCFTNQHIYITSDEEIKPYDWGLSKLNEVRYMKPDGGVFCKKIILTTDQDLIKDGVQAIDDEFLEWFVKNPSCERVEVVFNNRGISGSEKILKTFGEYKIIIPKKEKDYTALLKPVGTKQSAVEYYFNLMQSKEKFTQEEFDSIYEQVREMERQQKSYSEEEVKNIVYETIEKFYKHFYTLTKAEMKEQWFEQFKKK